MKIIYKKKFQKQIKKLWWGVRVKFDSQILLFKKNKFDIRLNNHSLNGKYIWLRSINVTWDIRALYYEQWDEIVIFALIGSHSGLY